MINKIPVDLTPCLVKVEGFPIEPTIDGYCLAIAYDKKVLIPSPMTGKWYIGNDGADVTGFVTDIILAGQTK